MAGKKQGEVIPHKQLTRAVPLFSSDSVENIFLPSNIKQSYRVGFEAEFMWMHLNKPSTTLTYNPQKLMLLDLNSKEQTKIII